MLGLPKFQAEEVRRQGSAFAKAIARLASIYSTDNLARTNALKGELDALEKARCPGKEFTLLQKAKQAKIKAGIRGPVRAMWDAFYTAKVAEQAFYYTHDLFRPDVPATGYLTAVLTELDRQKRLPNPQKVTEGREVLERLTRERRLVIVFGYDIKPEDKVTSHAWEDIQRMYR